MIIKDSLHRDLGRIFVWYPFRWLIQFLPLPVVAKIGCLMGRLEGLFVKKKLKIMAQNLRRVLDHDEERALNTAGKNLERHYVHLLEFFKFPFFSKNNIDRYIEYQGTEYLDSCLKKGKGVILIHLHFGTMQIPLIALGLKGYSMYQLGQREPENKNLSWVHRKIALHNRLKIESSIPAKIINVGMTNSLRPLFRCLEDNNVLMITGDGRGGTDPVGKKDVLVNFLGQKTYFPRGPAMLARKTGAMMLPLFCFQVQNGCHRVEIQPSIPLNFSDDKEKDILYNTQLYADILAKEVRSHPDHWMFWQEFSPDKMICGLS